MDTQTPGYQAERENVGKWQEQETETKTRLTSTTPTHSNHNINNPTHPPSPIAKSAISPHPPAPMTPKHDTSDIALRWQKPEDIFFVEAKLHAET
jgi:hypothetical protein